MPERKEMAHISVVSKEALGEEVSEDELDPEKGFEEVCKHLLEGKILFQSNTLHLASKPFY